MDRIEVQILQSLLSGERSVYEVIDRQDASLLEFVKAMENLISSGFLEFSKGILRITEKGKEILRGFINLEAHCSFCEGTGYLIDGFYSKILSEFKNICKDRPPAVERFDQGFIDEEGVIRRLEFIHERGDIYGKFFIVGDDDLFSIAASLTGLPAEIVVIDVDERLVKFINKISKSNDLGISAYVYDVQKKFPEEFYKKFDVFVTDPVETIDGIKLFLSRGVSTLKGVGCAGYFGLTTLEASRRKWYEIEKMILEMGFVITDVRRRFNIYPANEKSYSQFEEKLPIYKMLGVKTNYNWYTSSFFRIEAVKEPKPIVDGEMIIDEHVYKDEESLATPY
ncbi:MAG: bis-aminopropyl spermidine synthase family protein [Archaeoglobaceae archaeon]|nr:bis-aminopropyl spermidine synthase family protein [Archaeoglobaceae archaeon]MDW7989342.1 bis-aminopropyl spermidine synthase family protein [Archaeoglobaceae archaeon]